MTQRMRLWQSLAETARAAAATAMAEFGLGPEIPPRA